LERALFEQLLLIGILLVGAAFFSGSKTALFSLNTAQIERFRARGGMVGRLIASMLQRPSSLITTFLVGKVMVTVGLSVTATSVALHLTGGGGEYLAILVTTITLLVCEVTPKHIGLRYPASMARLLAWPTQVLVYALLPARWSLRKLVDALMADYVGPPISLTTTDELKSLVELSKDDGIIDQAERNLIQRVFEFSGHRVSQIMTPRTDVFALEVNESLATALPKIKDNRFSRIPLYEGSTDQVVGILYAKDLLPYSRHPEPEVKLRDLLHPVFFVPESKRIDDLLREFQRNKVHMAIVVDEYGGVSGLATMEDALEELVGEIVDEFDIEEILYRQIAPQTYVVSAKMALGEFNRRLGVSISRDDADTIGGHVFHLFGMLPKRGESVSADGLTFTIEHVKGTRIIEIRVRREEG